MVLRYQVMNGICVEQEDEVLQRPGLGQNMLWICWIWSVLLKAVTKMK